MRNLHRIALTIGLLALVTSLAAQLVAQDPALHPVLEPTGDRPRVAERPAEAPGTNLGAPPHQEPEASARRVWRERRGLGTGSALFPAWPDVGTAATPEGGRAHELGAPPSNRSAPRALFPPRGQILAGSAESVALRVTPAEASGDVLLADENGEVFGRHAIPAHPSSAGRVLDLHLALPPEDTVVWLAHENPDGRRSEWRAVTLEENP